MKLFIFLRDLAKSPIGTGLALIGSTVGCALTYRFYVGPFLRNRRTKENNELADILFEFEISKNKIE